MTEPAGEPHAALVRALRAAELAPEAILDAFAAVPRHLFLPGVGPVEAYCDDAIVTAVQDGVPTSSSSQPSLMARMLAMLELEPGQRVLEIGAGTGYNAALMAALGARVTTVELQPAVAAAAREHLAAAGVADAVEVVCGDGAAPPAAGSSASSSPRGCGPCRPRSWTRWRRTAGSSRPCASTASSFVVALRRRGAALSGTGGLPCGFMPLQGPEDWPWRWELGAGGTAAADADLGVEGRGALDRLLASAGRDVPGALPLRRGEHVLHALLWLALQGDPLLTLSPPRERGRGPRWTVALHVLPASLLVLDLGAGNDRIARATLYGGEGALRACAAALAAWRAAGSPGTGGAGADDRAAPQPQRLDAAVPRSRRHGHDGPRRAPLAHGLRLSDEPLLAPIGGVGIAVVVRDRDIARARVEPERGVLARARVEPHDPVAEVAGEVLERAEEDPGQAAPARLRHDVHALDLAGLVAQPLDAAAGHRTPSSYRTTKPPSGGDSSDGCAEGPAARSFS